MESDVYKITEKELIIAAKWWGEAIRSPRFENDINPTIASVFATLHAEESHFSFTPEQIKIFQEKIIENLKSRIKTSPRRICIGIDYGPGKMFSEAFEAMNTRQNSSFCFPWKTNMWIKPGYVSVSCGYRAEIQDIYLNSDFTEKCYLCSQIKHKSSITECNICKKKICYTCSTIDYSKYDESLCPKCNPNRF